MSARRLHAVNMTSSYLPLPLAKVETLGSVVPHRVTTVHAHHLLSLPRGPQFSYSASGHSP